MVASVHSRPVVASLYSLPSAAVPSSSPSSRSGSSQPGVGGGTPQQQQQQQQQQRHRSHPFSSISQSPNAAYAVAAGKDVLNVLRVGSNGLEEIRSARISQHFQTPLQTTNTHAAGQNPHSPHLRDALRLPGAAGPSLPTHSTAGGGVNVTVTDLAWSMPQMYALDDGKGSNNWQSTGNVGVTPTHVGGSYDELLIPSVDRDVEKHHDSHFPPFIKRVYVGGDDGEHSEFLDTVRPSVNDTSVLAAAGSNGVVVAWSAQALIDGEETFPHSSNNSSDHGRLFHVRKNNVGGSATSIGQPEAAFLAHSRAVNRLAWHATGRRPYLLLTSSQDGTVKLWDRRATSSTPIESNLQIGQQSNFNLSAKSWFGFGGSQSVQNTQLRTSSAVTRTAIWHCVSTYQPTSEAVRDIKWSPVLDDLFALVAGEWLCVYDIRLNRPIVKESAHAGYATSVDWHPTLKYTIATGGERDRAVKVWNMESGLNIRKQEEDTTTAIEKNAGSYASQTDKSEMSASSHTSTDGEAGIQTQSLGSLSHSSAGSLSPTKVRRGVSAGGLSRLQKKKQPPLHILNIAAPVTRIRWQPPNVLSDAQSTEDSSLIAVATSSIYGANAGGNGSVGLWSCHRSFMPISICEGHTDGAVTDFVWAGQFDSQDNPNSLPNVTDSQTILTVGRDGQCLLQDFRRGERPILDVPKATFALEKLSPFQPGFGSLQIMSIHQDVDAGSSIPHDISKSELVVSITDQGNAEDLSKLSLAQNVTDVSPELTHFSRFSELYITSESNLSKADVCRHNADVAGSLRQNSVAQIWKMLATILEGSGVNGIPTNTSSGSYANPMVYMLVPTLRNILLQRANAGDVQTCVVLCEVMEVIAPPSSAGGSAKSRIAKLSISLIQEWYLSYIDIMQQMCLFTQAASLIKNCHDPVIGALNQQSTTIHESCSRCGKPLLGGTAIQDQSGTTPQLSAQRVCRNCRSTVGQCFLCHEPVKGIFVWCPGCGHGGHLEHALDWFATNEVCPTGCGHKCNLFPGSFCTPVKSVK